MDVFSVLPSTVQWLTTGFMLVNGVLVPITAYFMKRFTKRQLFISSMLFLLIGLFLCSVAPNFGVLLIGRMIQAIGAGIILPLLMTIVMFVFPAEKRGSMMGMIGLAMIFAPALGPTLAGFIIDYTSWRWLFIGLIPFVVIVIVLAFKYLVNVSETEKMKLDVMSVILSTIGFGAILYGLSTAGSKGWSDTMVIVSIIVGGVITGVFTVRQLKLAEPLLNLTVFKNNIFSFITMPLNTAGLNALPKQLITHGTAINNTLRQIAGAIGTAVIITIFSTMAANHAEELAANGITENMKNLSITLGTGDAYFFMTTLAFIGLILTLFIPNKNKKEMMQS